MNEKNRGIQLNKLRNGEVSNTESLWNSCDKFSKGKIKQLISIRKIINIRQLLILSFSGFFEFLKKLMIKDIDKNNNEIAGAEKSQNTPTLKNIIPMNRGLSLQVSEIKSFLDKLNTVAYISFCLILIHTS